MHSTKVISGINNNELEMGISAEASWHNQFNSAYVYVGGINNFMNEGDLSIVFSQYGDLVDVCLVRDKKTGKSKGFAFICYEDQRSAILAVDNFNGYELCGRTIRVDHVKEFKIPSEFLQVDELDTDFLEKVYKPSGADGRGWGRFRDLTSEEEKVIQLQKKIQLNYQKEENQMQNQMMQQKQERVVIDEDERWDRLFQNQDQYQEIITKKIKKEKKNKEHKSKDKKEKKKDKKEKKEKKKDKKEQKEKYDLV